MILSHKSSFFTDCHFPTEAIKASREFSQICLSQAGCELIPSVLLCVFQDALFHKESVAVMEYNTVKETIWAKLALLSGKLCYKTKMGVLVCALVRVSFSRGEELNCQGSFPYLSSSAAADKSLELHKNWFQWQLPSWPQCAFATCSFITAHST